jgi:hypothetical protein
MRVHLVFALARARSVWIAALKRRLHIGETIPRLGLCVAPPTAVLNHRRPNASRIRRTQGCHSILKRLALLLPVLQSGLASAAAFTEDFSSNPAGNGWQLFGNPNLFQWDAMNQNLRVTWDSTQTNSYCHRPLGTILTPEDDFQLGFDLTFEDYVGGLLPGKPGAFEAAIGFFNLDQATRPNFFRGAGRNALGPLNLVEFNFFPAFDVFLPTIAQTIVTTNHKDWLYNHDNLQDLTPGQIFAVRLSYVAATRTLTTTVTNNGAQYGPTQTITVPASYDFRVATFSISSYSDAYSLDSLLAHGTVDNIALVTPPPPVGPLSGGFNGAQWEMQFASRTNWLYTLERATDLLTWSAAAPTTPGNGTVLTLSDTNPPAENAVYRVRAQRP